VPRKYDIEEVIAKYWHGPNSERAAIVDEFRHTVVHGSRTFKLFLAEVAEEIHKNKLQPVNAIACAMMYGMALGVMAEKERAEKEQRRIIH